MTTIKIHPIWYICITIRIFIPIILFFYRRYFKNHHIKYIQIYKYILLLIGIGFGIKAIFGSNNETQIAKVFWHNTRFIHALIFICSAIYFNNNYISTLLLLASPIFSIFYRFTNGHF